MGPVQSKRDALPHLPSTRTINCVYVRKNNLISYMNVLIGRRNM